MNHRPDGKPVALVFVAVVVLSGVAGVSTTLVGDSAAAIPAPMAGSGTSEDPYVVTNVMELQRMEQELDAHYVLGNDIDASDTGNWNGGKGFDPIGDSSTDFSGSFDGQGYVVSNLTVNRSSEQDVGPFGRATGMIANVEFTDIEVIGDRRVGGLAGYISDGTVTNVALTDIEVIGGSRTGGITGWNVGGTVNKSYATGNVSGDHSVGGIAGDNTGTVRTSFANSNVTGNTYTGGILGYNYGGTVRTTYATGTISGSNYFGGITGYNGGTVDDSYWDTQSGGHPESNAGTRLTTAQMTGAAAETNMDGFDFDSVWTTTDSYPELRAFLSPADVGYANPAVSPTTIYQGSAIDAEVTVSNTGGQAGDYAVSLSVDGQVVAWENGSIAGGDTETVRFTKTLWDDGDRTVTVAGGSASATETVTVQEANAKYHGDNRNLGHYPDQSGPTSEPVEAWSITDRTPQVMQPAIVGDTLYMAFHDGGKLYALDPETGAEKWNATPGGRSGSTWTTPAYANGVLYLGSNDYKLHAINATDGTELWNYSTQTNVRSAPAVVDDVVYFGSNDGNLTAVNATTGEELWFYTMYLPVLVESNPAVVDGVVYITGNDDHVTAVNATTGQKIWNTSIRDQSQSDPTVANGTVFVGVDSTMGETSGTGAVLALNATDGSEVWHYNMSGDVDGGQVYADGVVYAGSRGGDLVALNATDGTEVWKVSGTAFRGAPVVAGGVLYVSDFGNGSVHAFDADTGDQLWWYESDTGNLYPTPLAWNGYLYYGSGSHFYALEQPAPAISNFAVTNPSGGDVQVAFDSDTQLANISVSISGAESTTLTEGDFTESSSPGSYTYTATYAGSTDGTYTATLDTAEDADGEDGAGGESDSVDVDTTPPTLTEYAVANPDSQTVTVAFNSTEQLATVEASVSGAESASLTTGDFVETDNGDGTYEYTATYEGSSDGTYTVTLDTANDSAANDGSSGESDSVDVDTTPPTVSNYAVTNPEAQNVSVSFDTDEQLATVEATVSGAESESLATADFAETDNGEGTYTYTATYEGSADGTYSITLNTATDSAANDGASGESASVVVDTTDPTADAGSDLAVDEGTQVGFDGSGSSDNLGIASYEWAFGDGTTDTGHAPSHTYADPGTYTVTLTVTDDAGNADTDTLTVTVADTTPPTADAGADRTVDEDTDVAFDGTDSTDNVGIASYEWAFGDGSTNATGPSPTHNFTDPGTYTVTLTVTDAAGNSAYDALEVTVNDTTPPPAPSTPDLAAASDTGTSQTDDLTNDTTPTLVGTAEANATVEVTSDVDGSLGTATADGSGDWSFAPGTGLSEGEHVITATATDEAGNTGQDSAGLTITVDATAPPAPSAPDLTATSDTGESSTDDVTNETTPTLVGTAEADAVVEIVSDRDGSLGTATADGNGDWSFAPPSALSETTHDLTATATDAAGNAGAASAGLSVTVDTSAPAPPSTPDLPAANDTGRSSTDDLTNETTPTLVGTTESNAVVTVVSDVDGTLGTTAADGSGDWSFAPSSALAEGTHVLAATATDVAGNTGTASGGLSVTVDTTPPPAPAALDLAPESDTGRSSTDDLTNETKPTLTGTAAANATVEVTSDVDGSLGTTTADGGGNWSLAPSSALSETTHGLTATATDEAGNTGPASGGPTVTVDTTAPAAPPAPDLTAASDSGTSNTDDLTNETTPTLTGTAAANATVTVVSDRDGSLGTTTADGTGDWSFAPSSALSEATHVVTVTATDVAGNSGPSSSGLTVTVDTSAPAAPSPPDLAAANDTGTSDADDMTNETTPTLTGTAEADATVAVTSDVDGDLGSVTADGNGDWSVAPSSALSETTHSFTVTATDEAGNTGTASGGLSVVIDTTAPAAPSTPDLPAANDTGRSSTDDLTNETAPTLTGTAEADAIVEVFSDRDGPLGTTTANGTGDWSFAPGTGLSEATHGLTAVATDVAGNTGTASGGLTVTVDTTAPAAPSAPDLSGANDTGTSNTDDVTNETAPTLTGTAEADAVVEIVSDRDGSLGTATSNGTGGWSFAPGTALSEGTHDLTATATDAAGNAGPASAGLGVTVDASAPDADAGTNRTVDEDTVVAFDASNSTDNDAIAGYGWAFGDGANATGATANHTFADPGTYDVTLAVTDVAGNPDTHAVVVTVNDTTPPTAVLGNDTTVRIGTTVDFDASNSTDNVGVVAYEWTFGDGANATGPTTNHTFGSTGTFAVALDATDAAGNRGSAVRNVTVRPRPVPPSGSQSDDADEGPAVVVNTTDDGGRSNVSVRNVDPGRPIVIAFGDAGNATGDDGTGGDGTDDEPATPENVSLSRLTVNVRSGENFTLNVTTRERATDTDEAFRRDTGATPAGYVVVDHSVSDEDVADVTFRFRVRKTYVETMGLDPGAVALYRDEGTAWRELDAALVDETDTHYVFEATSPGLSTFVIGSSVPAFEVTAADLAAAAVAVGDRVEVTVAVENLGGIDGSYDAVLLADGERVAGESLAVDAFGEATATLGHAFDAPGTYELVVGDRVVGTVTVEAAATTGPTATATPAATATSTAPATGTPGANPGGVPLALVLVVVLLVAGGVAVYWRRTRNGF